MNIKSLNSSIKLAQKKTRHQLSHSLLEYYTYDILAPTHKNLFLKTLNKHKEKGTSKHQKRKSKKKNISSSSVKNNNNINKSTTHSKTSNQFSENTNSQSKVPTFKHDSSSTEKINLSQIDKTYMERLKEKDEIITHLQTELLVYKNMYKSKCSTNKKKNKSYFDLKIEDIQKGDNNRNKKIINLCTFNTRNIYKIFKLNQSKSKSIALYTQSKTNSSSNNKSNHISNHYKIPQKTDSIYSKSTDSIPLINSLCEIERKGERYRKAFDANMNIVGPQYNKNRTQSNVIKPNNTEAMLSQLKQKTLSVLNKYNNNIHLIISNAKQ